MFASYHLCYIIASNKITEIKFDYGSPCDEKESRCSLQTAEGEAQEFERRNIVCIFPAMNRQGEGHSFRLASPSRWISWRRFEFEVPG